MIISACYILYYQKHILVMVDIACNSILSTLLFSDLQKNSTFWGFSYKIPVDTRIKNYPNLMINTPKRHTSHLKPLICMYLENKGYGRGSSFTMAMPFRHWAFCMKKTTNVEFFCKALYIPKRSCNIQKDFIP